MRAKYLLLDLDTCYHIAAGRWILEHRAIPTTDPFSYTMFGAPWTAHEWLSEVIFASSYAIGGWSAVVAVPAAACAWALALLTRYLLRYLAPMHALAFVSLSAGLMMPHLFARPHLLAAPVLVAWAIALVRAREDDRAPSLLLTPLMSVWANLHGSFPLGLVLAGAFGLEAMLAAANGAERRRAAGDWGKFLVFAALAALINPHGVYGVTFAIDLLRMTFAMDHIAEWQSPDFHTPSALEIWLLVAAAVTLSRGLRLPPLRLALFIGLIHLSLKARRHSDLLSLLAPIIVGRPLSNQLAASHEKPNQAVALDRAFAALALPATSLASAAVILLLTAIVAVGARLDTLRVPGEIMPVAALDAVRQAFPGGNSSLPGPVFNDYGYGGYLIFSGIPVFIDARADLFGDKFMEDFLHAVELTKPDALLDLLEKYQVGWTLLKPNQAAVALLDHLPGWRRLYSDEVAVVHVRSDSDPCRIAAPTLPRGAD